MRAIATYTRYSMSSLMFSMYLLKDWEKQYENNKNLHLFASKSKIKREQNLNLKKDDGKNNYLVWEYVKISLYACRLYMINFRDLRFLNLQGCWRISDSGLRYKSNFGSTFLKTFWLIWFWFIFIYTKVLLQLVHVLSYQISFWESELPTKSKRTFVVTFGGSRFMQ